MTTKSDPLKDQLAPAVEKDPRAARLAAQLRENLKRRKAQARGRKGVAPDTGQKPDL